MITLSRMGRPEPQYPEYKEWKRVFTTHNKLTQKATVSTNGKEYRVALYPAGEKWVSYFDLDDGNAIYSYVSEFLEESYSDAMDYVENLASAQKGYDLDLSNLYDAMQKS